MIEKIALTGAPGSGKSSILRELQSKGERTIAEAAQDIITYWLEKGMKEPWKRIYFQDEVLALQLEREEEVEKLDGRVFIDRGILDGLAYYQFRGNRLTEAMKKAIEDSKGRYKRVFLIELGNNCEKTGVRSEDLNEARRLEDLQYKNYSESGYKIERIPYIPIKERAEMILNKIEETIGGIN